MTGPGKRINHTKEVEDAKAAGWGFAVNGDTVVITAPLGLTKEEADKARPRILQSVVDIAVRHVGYCYDGCK